MDIKRIYCMIEKLTECAEHEVNKGIESLDTEEFGKVADMIKDLSEAMYYRTITEAMKDAGTEYGEDYDFMGPYHEEKERRYYNHNRYSNGRYAPKGRGRRMGYSEPRYHMTPEEYRQHEYDPEYWRDMDREKYGKMYYTESGMSGGNMSGGGSNNSGSGGNSGNSNSGGGSRGYSGSSSSGRDGREGRSGASRRSYMETKEMHKGNTPDDKQKKMQELEHYMKELSEDMTEMISDASNEEKTMLKQKLSVLVQKI